MKSLLAFGIFYRKLIFPVSVVSALAGILGYILMGDFSTIVAGMTFILLTPAFHYFIYEVMHPEEYYFYYNMGLSRLALWLLTISASTLAGLILILL